MKKLLLAVLCIAAPSVGLAESPPTRAADAPSVRNSGSLDPQRAEKQRQEFDARLASVRALQDALRRIAKEKNATARVADDDAKITRLVRDAENSAGSDPARAKAMLDEAYAAARTSIESLKGGETVGGRPASERSNVIPSESAAQKQRRDFDSRLASVRALQEALQRIAKEKNATARIAQTDRKITELMGDAERQAARDLPGARAKLDDAYLNAKLGVESLRHGETLVRSLNFASKEEEFRYEVDRNDAHLLLIKLLLEEKANDARVTDFVERAKALRQEGDALAARGDHAKAVERLEGSTRELQRAIRNAGVLIPG